jgi:DNA-binding CsgD family transcriptional regulator/P2-related tail formation protein
LLIFILPQKALPYLILGMMIGLKWTNMLLGKHKRRPIACSIVMLCMAVASAALAQRSIGADLRWADSVYESAPDTAFYLAKSAYLQSDAQSDYLSKGKSALLLGKILYHQGQYGRANEYLLEAGEIFTAFGEEPCYYEASIWLGALHQSTRQYAIAFKFYLDALQFYQKTGKARETAIVYGWMGQYYEKIQHYDSAKHYQWQALRLHAQLQSPEGVSEAMDNLGGIYEDLAFYDSALYYFEQSATINRRLERHLELVTNLNDIGDVYRKQGRHAAALAYSDSALGVSRRHGLRMQEKYALRDKAKVFGQMQRYDSAFWYAELSYDLHNDLLDDQVVRRISLLSSLYESHKKERRIEQLEEGQKWSRLYQWALGLAVLAAVAGGGLLVKRYRRKRAEAQISLEKQYSTAQALQRQIQALGKELGQIQAQLDQKQQLAGRLNQEITLKEQALSSHLLRAIHQEQMIDEVKSSLSRLRKQDKKEREEEIKSLLNAINAHQSEGEAWQEFQKISENIHHQYFERLQENYPSLSPADLKLASLLKLNLDQRAIASILGVSPDSLRVARYRLRKKLNLEKGDNLVTFLMNY